MYAVCSQVVPWHSMTTGRVRPRSQFDVTDSTWGMCYDPSATNVQVVARTSSSGSPKIACRDCDPMSLVDLVEKLLGLGRWQGCTDSRSAHK